MVPIFNIKSAVLKDTDRHRNTGHSQFPPSAKNYDQKTTYYA